MTCGGHGGRLVLVVIITLRTDQHCTIAVAVAHSYLYPPCQSSCKPPFADIAFTFNGGSCMGNFETWCLFHSSEVVSKERAR